MNRLISGTMNPTTAPTGLYLSAPTFQARVQAAEMEKKKPMFKRSFLMVATVLLLVFASAFTGQMMATRNLPSSYDPGLSIEEAFQTSKTPLLVEFYSDTCTTCQRIAPIVHELEGEYKDRLTLVMVDVGNPDNQQVAKLFGVDELPGLFVFDFKHMKKYQVDPKDFTSKGTLQQALDEILSRALLRADSPS